MKDITTTEEFASVRENGRVVVEFYTDWCPDCRRIEPSMPAWEEEFADTFSLLRMNCEQVPAVAEELDIRGIPTLIAFEDGKPIKRLLSRDAKTVAQVHAFLADAFAE